MNIKLNKTAAQILSIAALIILLLGASFKYLYVLQKGNDLISNMEVLSLLLLSPLAMVRYWGAVIAGFWLYFQAGKLDENPWTWFFLGILGGTWVLIPFFLHLFMKKEEMEPDFLHLFQGALIILIIQVFLNATSLYIQRIPALFTDNINIYEKMNFKAIAFRANYHVIQFLVLNISLCFLIFKNLQKRPTGNKILWLTTTLFSGLIAFVLYQIQLLTSQKKEIDENANNQSIT